MPNNLAIVDAVAAVAKRHGVSNAQVALAWLLAQGNDIVPIPGVKTARDHARQCQGSRGRALTTKTSKTIEDAAPNGKTAGPRYSPAGMARVKL